MILNDKGGAQAINFLISVFIIGLVLFFVYFFLIKSYISQSQLKIHSSVQSLEVESLISDWAYEYAGLDDIGSRASSLGVFFNERGFDVEGNSAFCKGRSCVLKVRPPKDLTQWPESFNKRVFFASEDGVEFMDVEVILSWDLAR
ncbi:hypothetical protein D6825_01390 [Candidatus Woesearchaeota archaeon]|nr:MAG: hypothetical protein D6825_01390 [Candidatus Woesearchaeota archaeon]